MKACPICHQSILRYEPAGTLIKDEKAFNVQKVYCDNPQCVNYCGKEAKGKPIDVLSHELKTITELPEIAEPEESV